MTETGQRPMSRPAGRPSERLLERLRSGPPAFAILFGAIALAMVFIGRAWYFGAGLFETGDLAANSIQIDRAAHLLEIYGNYSRFEFHHPGPAFFYVYAAGQVVFFDILHLVPAPHNGQLLAAALLQAFFLSATIWVIARFAAGGRNLFMAVAGAAALVHFSAAGYLPWSLWPPDQLVIPFACFAATAIAVATGRLGLLPLLVVCGGFLIHGHVAQPLFVGLMGPLALAVGTWFRSRDDERRAVYVLRGHVWVFAVSAALVCLFLLPLAIDATRGSASNLAAILHTLVAPRTAADYHSMPHIVAYVLSFAAYPTTVEILDFTAPQFVAFLQAHALQVALSIMALAVLPLALLAFDRLRQPKDLPGAPAGGPAGARPSIEQPVAAEQGATAAASGGPTDGGPSSRSESSTCGARRFYLAALAVVTAFGLLTLVWVTIQRDQLYQFNSYFIYGLTYVAMLPSIVAISRFWPARHRLPGTVVAIGVAVALTASTSLPLPGGEDTNGQALDHAVGTLIARRTASAGPVLLEFDPSLWPQATGIALALQRRGVEWWIDPRWAFMFGSEHAWVAGSSPGPVPEVWSLAQPQPAIGGEIDLTDRVALFPPPPSLASP